jgi:GNAT superfamily N-acetyltransferase
MMGKIVNCLEAREPSMPQAYAFTGRQPAEAVTVREVAWHHLAAVALRESQAAEMLVGYSGRPQGPAAEALSPGAGAVAYTGVAFTPEGLPVGHAALRWNDDDIELRRVYVTPPYRCSGTAAALLAAAEEAARALHVRRIILRPGDQQFGDARFWEGAGYTRVASIRRGQSTPAHACLEKVIGSGSPLPPGVSRDG